jgi:hypothetical protein
MSSDSLIRHGKVLRNWSLSTVLSEWSVGMVCWRAITLPSKPPTKVSSFGTGWRTRGAVLSAWNPLAFWFVKTSTLLPPGPDPISQPGTVAVIRPPHIITEDFDRSSFKVYEIPVLSPRRSDIEQIPFVRARPVRKVPMDTKLERLITTTTWTRSNPYSPSYFAGKSLHGKLLFFTGNSSPSLPLHNVPKAPIPAYVPLASGYTFDGSPLAVRCLGDHMVTVSLVESRLTKRNLVIQAYPTRSSSIESKSLRKTQQFDISGFPMAFDICFVTGRGCYVEASELRLLEFDP